MSYAPKNPLAGAKPERTPQDYAIEHAEYMAQDAERLLDTINHLNAQRDEDGDAFDSDALARAEEAVTEAFGSVRNGIYEFRKRRDRAAAQPAGAQQPGAAYAALPEMPPTDDRKLYNEHEPDGYLESDNDWIDRNLEAVRWFIDNHAALRASHGQAHPTVDDLCARIKAADDAAADRDYMLDSNDCIAILRGEWKGPLAMDKPERASHGQAPAQASPAEWLEQAFREGWAACLDAEFVGEQAEDWAFGNSSANSRMIDIQQAAPAAVAGPSLHSQIMNLPFKQPTMLVEQRPEVAYALGFRDACHAAAELVSAVPTTQPAPQQEAQEPVAVVVPCHTPSGKRVALYSAKQDLPIGTQLYTAHQPSPAAQGEALESEYRRGYRHGHEQRDAEVRGALA